MYATLGKHKTDHRRDQRSKHHLHYPARTLPVLSSHIPSVCGYHTRKHSCVTRLWTHWPGTAQRMALHTISGASPYFGVILKAGIPKSVAVSMSLTIAPRAAARVLEAMQMTAVSWPRP